MKKIFFLSVACLISQCSFCQDSSARNAVAQENTTSSSTTTISSDVNSKSQSTSVITNTTALQTTGDLKDRKKKNEPGNQNNESPK